MAGRPGAGPLSGDDAPGRDRDPAGRPRNARPRDAAGRPLPRGATGVERVPDDLVLAPQDALDLAQQLLDEGSPFPAHDVLEAVWKQAAPADRATWRALAQLAVGLTHAQRGNAAGAVALLRRAAAGLDEPGGRGCEAVDREAVAHWARAAADRIDTTGTAAVGSPPRLRRRSPR